MPKTEKITEIPRKPAPQAGIDWLRQRQQQNQERRRPSSGDRSPAEGQSSAEGGYLAKAQEQSRMLNAAEAHIPPQGSGDRPQRPERPKGRPSAVDRYRAKVEEQRQRLNPAEAHNSELSYSKEYRPPYQSFSQPRKQSEGSLSAGPRENRLQTRTEYNLGGESSYSKRQGVYFEGREEAKEISRIDGFVKRADKLDKVSSDKGLSNAENKEFQQGYNEMSRVILKDIQDKKVPGQSIKSFVPASEKTHWEYTLHNNDKVYQVSNTEHYELQQMIQDHRIGSAEVGVVTDSNW